MISLIRIRLVSRWREFAFMLHEMQKIIVPTIALIDIFDHWNRISNGLIDKTRKRKMQIGEYYT